MDVLSDDFEYINSGNILADMSSIIEKYQINAYKTINAILIERNWLLGKRIAEEELKGKKRADYRAGIINSLSKELTKTYGKGFTKTNLYSFSQFYKMFPEIFHSVSGKSILLSWTHYRTLLRVTDENARNWYVKEAHNEMWSVRTLENVLHAAVPCLGYLRGW